MDKLPTTHLPPQVIQAVSRLWWVILVRGVLSVLVGLYALFQPGMTLITFTQVLGAFVLIDGALAVVHGILGWTATRAWTLLRGVLGILVGLFVLTHPVVVGVIAATTLVLIIGIQTIASGVLEIYIAIRARKDVEGEGWLILVGLLAIVFGGILVIAPFLSTLVLIRLLGASSIMLGIALIVNSFRIRKLGTSAANSVIA